MPPGASTSRSSSSASTLGRSPYWLSDSAAHSRAVAQAAREVAAQQAVQHARHHGVAGADAVEDDDLAGGDVVDLVARPVPAQQPVAAHRHDDVAGRRRLADPAQHRVGLPRRDAQHGDGVVAAAEEGIDVGDQRSCHSARLLGRPQPRAVVHVEAHRHAGLARPPNRLEHQVLGAGQGERDPRQVQQPGVEQVGPVDVRRRHAGEAGVAAVEPHLDRARRDGVLDVVGGEAALGPAHGTEVDAGQHVLALDAAAERRVGERADPAGAPAEPRERVRHVALGAGHVDVEAVGALEPMAGRHAQAQLALAEGGQVEAGPPDWRSIARGRVAHSLRLASIVP
jgi:hypothetical protein